MISKLAYQRLEKALNNFYGLINFGEVDLTGSIGNHIAPQESMDATILSRLMFKPKIYVTNELFNS